MFRPLCTYALFGWVVACVPVSRAEDDPAAAQEVKPTYLLKYKLQPGESLWHEVTHTATSETTVNGVAQSTETETSSVKVWQIRDISSEGNITLVYSVDSMRMRTKITGRAEVGYDSTKDDKPTPGYEDAARAIGIPLVELTVNSRGKVLNREVKAEKLSADIGNQLVLPLPEAAVSIGATWTVPSDFDVTIDGGGAKRIKARQHYELKKVKYGVAEIAVQTQILTPIDNPKIEVQTMQRLSRGTVRFDLNQGRVVEQSLAWDERVIGFAGNQSGMKFVAKFSEKLVPSAGRTARKPAVAPEKSSAEKSNTEKASPGKASEK